MIKLGLRARDKVTQFEGIVTGRSEWLYGCDQYCLVGESRDGKPGEAGWYDEGRLEVIGHGVLAEDVAGPRNGGPQWDAPRAR